MISRRTVTLATACCLLGLIGCGGGHTRNSTAVARLRVAVSLPPQAWMVERLAGDRAQIEVILPPAISPETWAPTPAAMIAVGKADLFFAVGRQSLAFETRLLAQAEAGGAQTVVFVAPEAGSSDDPHPWLDLDAVGETAAALTRRLEELDPSAGSLFADNHERLRLELTALELRLEGLLAGRQRDLVVVQHPAWGRLLARFGIEEVAIERDGKEPDPSAMIALVELARRERVEVIFTQRGTSPRSARLIGAAVGARIEVLEPLARDWPEALERSIGAFAEALR